MKKNGECKDLFGIVLRIDSNTKKFLLKCGEFIFLETTPIVQLSSSSSSSSPTSGSSSSSSSSAHFE